MCEIEHSVKNIELGIYPISEVEESETYYTKHFYKRMKERSIVGEMVDTIFNNGQLNERGDQIRLSRKSISAIIKEERKKLKILESLLRRGGGTIVTTENAFITVYTNN